jgi:GTPase
MRAGFIGMVGLPNSGKSTLVNALVGEKVAIVSSKPQTTRKRVLGILNKTGLKNSGLDGADAQFVFVDAPGKIQDQKGLNAFLKQEYASVLLESDILIAVLNVDAPKFTYLEAIVNEVKDTGKPWLAVITKDDLPHPHRTVRLRSLVAECGVPCIAVSATRRAEQMKELLLPLIEEKLPQSPAKLFDDEQFTDQSERDIVAELVREKCFQTLHDELPFGLATKVMDYKRKQDRVYAAVDIVVVKKSHMPIVIGKGGQSLKRIGVLAREEASRLLGAPVDLKTFVKCQEGWVSDPLRWKEYGYVSRV